MIARRETEEWGRKKEREVINKNWEHVKQKQMQKNQPGPLMKQSSTGHGRFLSFLSIYLYKLYNPAEWGMGTCAKAHCRFNLELSFTVTGRPRDR